MFVPCRDMLWLLPAHLLTVSDQNEPPRRVHMSSSGFSWSRGQWSTHSVAVGIVALTAFGARVVPFVVAHVAEATLGDGSTARATTEVLSRPATVGVRIAPIDPDNGMVVPIERGPVVDGHERTVVKPGNSTSGTSERSVTPAHTGPAFARWKPGASNPLASLQIGRERLAEARRTSRSRQSLSSPRNSLL